MALGLGNIECKCCCPECPDGPPRYVTLNISGASDTTATIPYPFGTPDFVVSPTSSLNGTYVHELIYSNGTYRNGYDPDDEEHGGPVNEMPCTDVYESVEEIEVGDIFSHEGLGVDDTGDEDRWLRECVVRHRIYIIWITPTTVNVALSTVFPLLIGDELLWADDAWHVDLSDGHPTDFVCDCEGDPEEITIAGIGDSSSIGFMRAFSRTDTWDYLNGGIYSDHSVDLVSHSGAADLTWTEPTVTILADCPEEE